MPTRLNGWIRNIPRILVGLLFFIPCSAQERAITGRIVSQEDYTPLPGVTIRILPGERATSSAAGGIFKITASIGDTLLFTHAGYEPYKWAVGIQDNLEILLQPLVKSLDDIVVIGYGSQRRRDLTGSVSSVSGKDFSSMPVTNAGDAIQGRAAGVQIVSSGAPGSNATIRIRGTGTINNSDPLLVIDGVPSDIPLNSISPEDIASIEVLKDASAAAIYGSRGANGVVLISTKKGQPGKNQLSFKALYGQQRATSMVEMLDAASFAGMHNEMMANNGQNTNPAFADPESLGKGTDWLGALFQPAPMQQYGISYAGGNGKTAYYVSGAVLDQKGIVINTEYRRYTIQLNMDTRVFDWLKFGNSLSINHDIKRNGSYNIRSAMAALPTQSIYNEDGSYAGPVGQPSWVGDVANPIGKATLNKSRTNGYNILGNVFAEVRLFPFLQFKTTGGVQALFWDNRSWSPKYNWQPIPQPNSYLFSQFNKNLTWLWDNTLTYSARLGNDHQLTVLAGSSLQQNRYDFMNGSIQQFASDATQQLNNGTTLPTVGGSANEWALFSYFGRINYDYAGRYLLTATIRRDGSSRFGPANRFGTFPSASAAWRISEEEFFGEHRAVNELKLRAGYGITGNQNIGNYSFASVLQTVQYNFNGQPVTAIVPLAIPNPGVQWERVEQANIGLDASLFNNRISATLEAYLKTTHDMLVPMAVPITTGYSDIVVPSINLGKVENRGVELSINSRNSIGELGWTTGLNLTYNQNRIISLNDSVPLYTGSIGLNQNLAIQHPGGYPINEFYGFVTNGIFQNQKEVDAYATQVPGADPNNRTSPGDIRFRDLNNDGVIDDNDRTFIGNPNPALLLGLTNNFSYKGFDLTIFLQGIFGNKIYNANRIYQEGMAVAQNQTRAVLDRWTGEGTSNNMPRAVFNDPNKNTRVSDRFVENGSYLRVKNISLGYTFSSRLVQYAKMSSARIYISCQNLFTFTNYSGFDPEVPANGIDLNVYPVTRIISGGLNINF